MAYAIIKDDVAVELAGPFSDSNGVQHPASVLHLWSEQELAEIGVVRIVEQSVERGKVITRSSLNVYGNAVHREFELEDEDLTSIRLRAKSNIDSAAEQERQKHITPGAGQAMTYQSKAAEAVRYSETNGQGDYPFLSEEIGITGDTLAEVAATVLTMHHEWQIIGSQIERERLSAKKAVEAATTVEEINNINPVWP